MDIAAMKLAAEAAATEAGQFANGTSLTSEFMAFVDVANPAAVLELIASHERLLRVVKAFTALHEMPNSEGVQALAELGYDGNTTLTEFVRNLRDEALAAAGE